MYMHTAKRFVAILLSVAHNSPASASEVRACLHLATQDSLQLLLEHTVACFSHPETIRYTKHHISDTIRKGVIH